MDDTDVIVFQILCLRAADTVRRVIYDRNAFSRFESLLELIVAHADWGRPMAYAGRCHWIIAQPGWEFEQVGRAAR